MTTIDLGNLGTSGIKFLGLAAGDNLGYNASGPVGDLNGDGIADLLLVADATNSMTGTAYVLFGTTSGFSTDLSALGDGGFKIDGINSGDYAGKPALGIGDVNGDGIDDLAIGAITGGTNMEGESYVVFGDMSLGADIMLASLGSAGLTISGAADADMAGRVGAAGDFNNDGINDLIVGAYRADAPGADVGAVYVIFGNSAGLPATLDLASLGDAGLTITSSTGNGTGYGTFVAGNGDVNGDGIDDIVFSNGTASVVKVVFGSDGGTDDVDLDSLGSRGITLSGLAGGVLLNASVSIASDINGDGIDDLLVGTGYYNGAGTNRGAVFVIFGTDTPSDVDLSNLGDAGIRIDGAADNDQVGAFGVNGIQGDFNGDGYNDIVLGSHGNKAYIIFGGASLANIDLGSLGDAQGIEIMAEASGDGLGLSASGAGDVNGDGLADVRVGAPFNDAGGADAGAEYLLYGAFSASSTSGNDTLTGAGLDDSIDGGAGDDTIFANGGDDTLAGGDDNDLLAGGDGNDSLSGDAGDDRVFGQSGNDTESGGDGNDSLFGNPGNDTLSGEGDDDVLKAQPGDDSLLGGDGNDMLFGGADADVLEGAAGDDTLNGNSGGDAVSGSAGNDVVRGQGGDDVLNGGDGNDVLLGMSGFDTIDGGAGADTITGSVGDDSLTGGDDADVFQFAAGHGSDVVTDFADGEDLLSFVGTASIDDLTIVDSADGAAIQLASEGDAATLRVVLTDITADQLTADDFIFA